MNQDKYNFGSWVCIPIIGYLSYIINYLLDGFFQKSQDVIINGMKIFERHLDQIMADPFQITSYYNIRSIPAIVIGVLFFMLIDVISFLCRKTMMTGKEYGTAKWGNASEMRKRLTDKDEEANILFTQDFSLMTDKRCGLNRNIVVIGGSGSGKTFRFVGPNLMQANMSFVVTDPKGDTVRDYTNVLVEEGYQIKILNVIHPEQSDGYNPFAYIEKDDDVLKLIFNIIDNTTPKGAQKGDPFWEKSESLFMQAVFFYVLYEAENQYMPKNFHTFLMIISEAKVMEEEGAKSPLDYRFQVLDDDHIAKRTYRKFMSGAGDTLRSVIISVHSRLFPFESPGIQKIFEKDEMDLYALGEGKLVNGIRDQKTKTAMFIVIPDDDKSFNFVPGMLYTQMFQVLYASARKYNNCLPIPVQCYFDEFKNISMPSNYLDIEATCRSRNIGVVPIFQDKSQIQSLYKESAGTLLANCDTLLFLGGTDPEVKKFISESLGKQTIWKKSSSVTRGKTGSSSQSEDRMGRELMTPDEVGRMDNKECIVMIRGEYPIKGKKLDATKHKRAKQSGLFGKPYFHRKAQTIQWKEISEVRKNEIVLTYDTIMELLDSKASTFPSEEWIQKAEQLGEEKQREQEMERKIQWKAMLPKDFDTLPLVNILAITDFSKEYMDVIVKAIESGIKEEMVKSYICEALDEEEIERQIKIQRILKMNQES